MRKDSYKIKQEMTYYNFFLLIDKSCFDSLFNHEDMHEITRHLPVCHVEAPGQHEGAKTLPTASVQCIYYSHYKYTIC